MIGLPVRLFREQEAIRDHWRGRIRYLLVDEYQDTNGAQYELVRQIVGVRQAFTVVGDDAQAIYGFRAATVRNILDFPKQYSR